jgi:hypothetical protein
MLPLFMAKLIPSNELALIKPAASPINHAPSFPVTKSFILLGLHAKQASVIIGSPKS